MHGWKPLDGWSSCDLCDDNDNTLLAASRPLNSSEMALSARMQSARVVAGRRVQTCAAPRVSSVVGPRLSSKSFTQDVAAFQTASSSRVSGRAQRMNRVKVEAVKVSVGDLKRSDLEGKRVLVRADLNVPLDKALNISDDTRIRAAIPTLKFLLDNGAKVLLTSHLVSPILGLVTDHSIFPESPLFLDTFLPGSPQGRG